MADLNPAFLAYLANAQNPNQSSALAPYQAQRPSDMMSRMSPEQQQILIDKIQAAGIQGPLPLQTTAPVIAPKPGGSNALVPTPNKVITQANVPVSKMDQQHEMERELYEKVKQGLMQQGEGVNGLEFARNQIAATPTEVDLSPLTSYVDSIVPNSKLTEGYKRPESGNEKQARMFNVQDAIQKAKQGLSQEEIAALKEQLNAGIYKQMTQNQRLSLMQDRYGLMEDRAAAQAADAFDLHPNIEKLQKSQQQIDRDKHTLEGYIAAGKGVPLTILRELAAGQASALNGGGGAGLGNNERNDVNNASTTLASFEQKMEPGVQNVTDPELLNYYKNNFERLHRGFQNNLYDQGKAIANGRTYAHNPQAQAVLKAKVEALNPANIEPEATPPAMTKVSNGKETLQIPTSDLQEAIKSGYQEVK